MWWCLCVCEAVCECGCEAVRDTVCVRDGCLRV